MDTAHFTITMFVEQSPEEVFRAINRVRDWWSGEIEGVTDEPGTEFTYTVPGVHFSKQKITGFIPGRKVEWTVVDASLSFVENTNEWKGTRICFDITATEGKTILQFTHAGLVPQHECYNNCSNAWSLLINGNLKNLLATGQPQPSPW